MRRSSFVLALFALLCPLLPAPAAATDKVPATAALISETRGFTPGQALTVALLIKQDPGWHTYWRDPGDAGIATTLAWSLPAGVTASEPLWPKPKVFKDPGGLTCYGYEDPAVIFTSIQVPAGYAKASLPLKLKAGWLVCREICIPGGGTVGLSLPKEAVAAPSTDARLFYALRPSLGQEPEGYHPASGAPGGPMAAPPAADGSPGAAAVAPGLAWMLLLALLGGVLLNLMPCVLPVLSLKALSFVGQAHQGRSRALALAAAFAAGVLSSFWVLAAVVILLKRGGAAVGWGFQFQQPGFVLAMAALVLVFSLNLFGLFEVWLPGEAMNSLSKAGKGGGLAGSFGHGLVMTLLATPCTAPFLGSALGFAFAAPALQLLAIFTAVALGLALPYVLLAVLPASHAWLPKPGPWMLKFKEAMGFLLVATVLWLLWLLGKQVGGDSQSWAAFWLLLVAVAAWIWGSFGGLDKKAGQRAFAGLLALALAVGGGAWLVPKVLSGQSAPSAALDGWQTWSEDSVQALHAQGKPVFVDFSAEWCWTCKVNERATLANAQVQEAFRKGGVALLKADWTREDPAITAALKAHGRSGVPMYLYYPAQGDAVVLPEVITPGLVLQTLGH